MLPPEIGWDQGEGSWLRTSLLSSPEHRKHSEDISHCGCLVWRYVWGRRQRGGSWDGNGAHERASLTSWLLEPEVAFEQRLGSKGATNIVDMPPPHPQQGEGLPLAKSNHSIWHL